MSRDPELPGCLPAVVLAFALVWGCSAARQCGVEQAGHDLGAGPAAATPGEERQIGRPAGPLAPPEPAQSFRGARVSAMYLPGTARLSPVSDRLRVTAALVDARCYQLCGFVVGGSCLCDLDGQVRQFDGAGEIVGLAEMSNQHENK